MKTNITSSLYLGPCLGLCLGLCLGTPLDPLMSERVFVRVASAAPLPWTKARKPSSGSPKSLGFFARGCLQGAETLPKEGPGFKSIRRHRRRYFTHPNTVKVLKRIGAQAQKLKLADIEIGDLSMARGGRMPYGHKSHQNGLDADVWFGVDVTTQRRLAREVKSLKRRARRDDWPKPRLRDALFELRHPSLIQGRAEEINEEVWSKRHEQLLETAARQPEVARIFVHFRIKEKMCELYRSREESKREPAPLWLRKLRPWYGHHQHFHIRLKCPQTKREETQERGKAEGKTQSKAEGKTQSKAQSKAQASDQPQVQPTSPPECQDQGPLPPGPGCEGLSWFSRQEKRARRAKKKREEAAEKRRVAKLRGAARKAHRAKIAKEKRARAEKKRAQRERLLKLCGHLGKR